MQGHYYTYLSSLANFFNRLTVKKGILIIIIVGVIVFFNSFFNGFVWDDQDEIVNNTLITSLKSIPQIFSGSTFFDTSSKTFSGTYYRPVMTLYFTVIGSIFGIHPFPFHIFQVMIHIINSCLIFLLFKKFFRQKLSLFLSLIFLIHPVNVEAISYISASQEVLFLLFGLLALFSMLRWYKTSFSIVVTGALLLLSLLAKETGIAFLIMVPLYVYFFIQSRIKRYISLSIVIFFLFLWLRINIGNVHFTHFQTFPMYRLNVWQRLINIPEIVSFYIKNTLFPKDLAIGWNWTITTMSFSNFFLPLLLTLVGIFLVIFLGYSLKATKRFKVYLFFLVWTVIGLLIHLQLYPLDMTVADRWLYFPLVGFLGLIALFIESLKIKLQSIYVILICVLIITALGTRTVIRNSNWKDSLTLYSHDIQVSKESYSLENGLATQLYYSGNTTLAKKHFLRSIELNPYSEMTLENIALLLEHEGEHEEAIYYYLQSIKQGGSPQSYERLSTLLLTTGATENALSILQKAVLLYPQDAQLWLLLGLSEYKLGYRNNAINHVAKSYQLFPSPKAKDILDDMIANKVIEIAY